MVAETTRRIELPRYSDKYRPSLATQPTLKRKDLHQPFFPQEIYESYFNPKKRKISEKKASKKRVNLDDMTEDAEDKVRDQYTPVPNWANSSRRKSQTKKALRLVQLQLSLIMTTTRRIMTTR